ncbi:MAG: LysE family translocator [Synechococcus sp.]
MTLGNVFALFGAMFVLALLPSPSVFAVVARSLSSGFAGGLAMAIGIVAGDFAFIIAAVLGLAAIAESMTYLFVALQYVGGLYLIWLAIQLWSSSADLHDVECRDDSSLLSSFISGLLITLGDYKAIVFYVGFFPAFVDVSSLSTWHVGTILGVAAIAVGGVKVGYAFLADRARTFLIHPKVRLAMNYASAIVLFGTGLFVLAKR